MDFHAWRKTCGACFFIVDAWCKTCGAVAVKVVEKAAAADEHHLPAVQSGRSKQGHLSEMFPAAALFHPALQTLQLQLVPFQVRPNE